MNCVTNFSYDMKELFVKKGTLKTYEKDMPIFYKDDEGNKVYLIDSGTIKIVNYSEDGKELIFAIFQEGDIFGEMSVFDKKSRSACAIPMKTSRVYELDGSIFIDFLRQKPDMLLHIIKIFSNRIRELNDFLEDTIFSNLTSRVLNKLIKLSRIKGVDRGSFFELKADFTQGDLAGFIGCTRENLNRELKHLKDKGFIDYDKHSIKVFIK
ncbi:MAG: Crp/Fnr family transcriptional regulator [Proteobacteria bacterium]|nr:Crp/Fnr family transcriptional regulator [Pseudomonadota bacterium]